MYQGHMITIKQKDLPEAMKIILEHEGDFDKITRFTSRHKDDNWEITFKLHPYIYEDFEKVKNEFIKNGIQVL